jgi:CheY-like chemotaxis protein
MNMDRELNILLIEDDTSACKRFTEYVDLIENISIIAVTNNSFRALELVQEYLPDAVILDLELNQGKGNGLLFLQDLNQLSLSFKPFILVTTNNSSTMTYDYARQLGADFIMSKHQDDYSEKNAIEFLCMMKDIIKGQSCKAPSRTAPDSAEVRLKQFSRLIALELDVIGISPKHIGYQYLADAILLVIQDKTTNICAALAEKYHKTDSSIERAMQNAINKAWRTGDIENLLTHYKARISSDKGVPTLTEFIYYYAKKVKNDL